MISNLYPIYVNSVKSGVFDGSLAGFKDALIKRNIAFENLLPAVYREGLIGSGIETDCNNVLNEVVVSQSEPNQGLTLRRGV